jgi:hypothetical protein
MMNDMGSSTGTALALGVLSLLVPLSLAQATEDGGPPPATLTCTHVSTPGRVHCYVDAQVAPGESIAWGDVVLVHAPDFISVLRGRIGPHDATTRSPSAWRWEFALVAHGKGAGQVEGRARLVVCRDSTCLPRELPVAGRVVIGPDPGAPDAGLTNAEAGHGR